MRRYVVICGLIVLFCGMFGCATGTGPGVISIQPSAVCQTEKCKDSEICREFGQPGVVFGATEIGLVALTIEDPSTKPSILKGYKALFKVAFADNITYGQLANIVVSQFPAGKWSPLISLVTVKLGRLTGNVQISQCDREFILDHCVTMITAMGGMP